MDINNFFKNFIKYQNKYLNLKNNMTGGNSDSSSLLNIYYRRIPTTKDLKIVKLNNSLINEGLYKDFHFGIIYSVMKINEDNTYNLQGIKLATNVLKEGRLINLSNVPEEHLNIVEDGKTIVELYPRNIPPENKSKCIITYFPESDRQKINKMVSQIYPTSVTSIEAKLPTILFDVLSFDGEYCEIKHDKFYYGRFPTKYLLFGEEHLKN